MSERRPEELAGTGGCSDHCMAGSDWDMVAGGRGGGPALPWVSGSKTSYYKA